jgi:hypothetical protein
MRLPRFWKDRRLLAISVVAIVIVAAISFGAWSTVGKDRVEEITFSEVMATSTSQRTDTYDHVIVASEAPILASAATPLAVWYDKPAGEYGMVPLLVEGEDEEAGQQARLKDYLSLSSPLRVDGPDHTTASIQAALIGFERAGGAVIVDMNFEGYTASMQASLIASYLDIPVIVREGRTSDKAIGQALDELKAKFVVLAGPFAPSKEDVAKELGLPVLFLGEDELEQAMNMLIADRFGRVDYGVLANPTDVSGISCVDIQSDGPVEWEESGRFDAVC